MTIKSETSIEWTDFTVNFWWGCTKVGPGCDHCYAETWDKRTGGAHWGPHAERRWIKSAAAALLKINDGAEAYHAKHGRWPRVFMHSMSDIFDNAVETSWRVEALQLAAMADQTRIQMVTKRIGNVADMAAEAWIVWPRHIGLMITVCNQAEADRDIPKLLDLKARLGIPWVGLSIEPMLGPIDLDWAFPDIRTACCHKCGFRTNAVGGRCPNDGSQMKGDIGLDWVICGGESGPHARPMHPDWARSLRDQCGAAGVPFLFKQWGEWGPSTPDEAVGNPRSGWRCFAGHPHIPKAHELYPENGAAFIEGKGKKAAGRLLDGRTWDEVPDDGAPRIKGGQ